jgi:hypothetical protein
MGRQVPVAGPVRLTERTPRAETRLHSSGRPSSGRSRRLMRVRQAPSPERARNYQAALSTPRSATVSPPPGFAPTNSTDVAWISVP